MRNTAQHAAHLPAVPRTILSACICVQSSSSSRHVWRISIGNPSSGGESSASRWLRAGTWSPWTPTDWAILMSSSDWGSRSTAARCAHPRPYRLYVRRCCMWFLQMKSLFCDLCVCYVFRRCQRPWVHSGGNSLIFTCTRRAEEFWRSPCGTETLGGGMTSLDGQLDLHLCGSALFNTMMNGDFNKNLSLIIKFSKCKKL